MTDVGVRRAERVASTGDLDAQADALNKQLRSGPVRWLECEKCEGGYYPSDNSKAGWRARRINCIPKRHEGPFADTLCNTCQGVGRVLWKRDDRAALAAYCGDLVAQVLVPACLKCAPLRVVVPDRPCTATRCWCCKGLVSVEGFCFPCQVFDNINDEQRCGRHTPGTQCRNCRPPPRDLLDWIGGLDRWQGALIRASLVAGRVIIEDNRRRWKNDTSSVWYKGQIVLPEVTIEYAERYLVDSTEANRKAWVTAWNTLPGAAKGWVAAPGCGQPSIQNVVGLCRVAAYTTNDENVRDAISVHLVRWAL